MTRFFKLLVMLIILAGAGFMGYRYWQHQQQFPSTDDAYIQAHVVNIAAQTNGHVKQTFVKEHQFIKAGTLLFTLVDDTQQLDLQQKQADLQNTKNQLAAFQKAVDSSKNTVAQRASQLQTQKQETERLASLSRQGIVSKQDYDKALAGYKSLQADYAASQSALANAQAQLGDAAAQIKAKTAAIQQAKTQLNYTKIYAPASGYVENLDLRSGDSVNAYQPVFALVEHKQIWVSANFKETDLNRIKIGQPATIIVDMYPKKRFHGKVSGISRGSGGSFSLLPPENASGNWVKVTQRFPIHIDIKTRYRDAPLRLGASCTVTIDARPS